MAVYQPKKVTAMPGSPTANTVYFVKNVGDSRIQMYVTDTSGTAFPVGILTENDVLGTSLAGFSTGSDIALSSSDTIIQAFQKVQGQLNALSTSVSQGIKVPLPLDCSTEPNYPAAEAGDSYKVTVAGKVGGASGPIVQVGDVFTALTDNGGGTEAAVGTQWFILQANTDNATESVTGLTRIATSAEVSAGSEAFAYVTPLTLNGKLVSELAGYVDLTSSQTITGNKTFSKPIISAVAKDANANDFTNLYSIGQGISYFTVGGTESNYPAGAGHVMQWGGNLSNSGSDRFTQLFSSNPSNEWYLRRINSSVDRGWNRIWHSGNFDPSSYQAAGKYKTLNSLTATTSTQIAGVNADTVFSYSNLYINTSTGLPTGHTAGFLDTTPSYGEGFIQEFTPFGGGSDLWFYRKKLHGASPTPWFQVASREWVLANYDNQSLSTSDGDISISDGNTITTVILKSTGPSEFGRDLTGIYANGVAGTYRLRPLRDSNNSVGIEVINSVTSTNKGGFDIYKKGSTSSFSGLFYKEKQFGDDTTWSGEKIFAFQDWVTSNFQPTIANPVTGTGVAGRVPYWGSTSNLTSHASLTYDPSTGLKSGTNTNPVRIHSNVSTGVIEFSSTSTNIIRTLGEVDLGIQPNSVEKWRFLSSGPLESVGPQVIRASSGNLTLATNSGDGNVEVTPNGAGQLEVFSNIRIYKDGVPEFRIGGNGNVAAPKVILAAAGSGGRTWTMQSGNSTNGVSSALSFSETSVPNLLVLSSLTRVGVNTDSPTDTIDVNGSARIRSMSIAAGDHFVMATGTGVLRKITPATTLTLIGAQAARSITSSSSNIEISGGGAGSTSTDINVVWGAADW